MSGIKLLVGLGNPGDKYAATRHNAGFWWIDEIAAQTNSKLTLDAKFFGIAGKLNAKADTWLLKPTTFMNACGKSVAALANYYKITPAEILVIHDELDLPAGGIKLKIGGGHGGHNGLKDIEAAPVSYTHLDVYKRRSPRRTDSWSAAAMVNSCEPSLDRIPVTSQRHDRPVMIPEV